MINFSDNVVMIEMGEPLPDFAGECTKILLAGSIDIGGAGTESGGVGSFDWITKFAQGVAALTDPINGMLMMRGQKYLLISTKYVPVNPSPTYDNPEFVNKTSWTLDMAAACDCIFINFLKRSTSQWPLFLFGLLSGSGKCVLRCPMEYYAYGLVRIISERQNIPLLPSGTSSVYSVISTMQAFIGSGMNTNSAANLTLPE